MTAPFGLLLFSVDPDTVREATREGIDAIVVDWERRGKAERQNGRDTEINLDTAEDLQRVRQATSGEILCRVNGGDSGSHAEIETAIEMGATEVLLPMVRSVQDVERAIRQVSDRCRISILVETPEAVSLAADLAQLPLARVYVGLNDLAITRRSASIFDAVADGTVDRLRECFDVPFGFGGLTLPTKGAPVPCRLLMAEMVRLDCSFSFLRRSFRRDIQGRSLGDGLRSIRTALDAMRLRSAEDVDADRRTLIDAIAASRAVSVPE